MSPVSRVGSCGGGSRSYGTLARHALWRGLFARDPVAGASVVACMARHGSGKRVASLAIGFAMAGAWYAPAALATCTALPTVVCTGTTNLGTTAIGTGPGTASGASVTVNSGATVTAGNASAISLGDSAVIVIGGTVQNSATDGDSYWGGRKNTIEFGSNGKLTVQAGGVVSSNGSQNSAEAVNVFGEGNTITNYGTLSGGNSAAIWFQDTQVGAPNIIDNYGTVSGTNSGSVLGNQGAGADVVFYDRSSGQVYGNIAFAGGNDSLVLEAGSLLTGNFTGGTGTNTLTLQGANGTSDSLTGDITNFQSLIKQGGGTWSLTGTVGNNGGNEPLDVQVQDGTLELLGNNSAFNGSVLVFAQGTLLGRAQSLPPTITDNGRVVFQQPDDGTYGGTISGMGSVAKTGMGVLTLSGTNSYQGGTTLTGGTVAVAADGALGAATGGIVLDGGALELTSSFDLGAARAISITANNGSIVTDAGVSSTLGQGITGAGAFTKGGAGTLVLTDGNSYTGGTTIAAGTLQLGNGGASGSLPSGNVVDNGTLAFDRSDTVSFANLVSGSGGVAQNGSGTTILTADNSYAGPTNVNAGALFVNGVQSGGGTTTVAGGAALGGSGTLGGDVVVNDGGTFTPGGTGTTPGTLTILGNLTLGNSSTSEYRFGEANVEGGTLNDLAQVQGNLTLGGTLNVTTSPGGSFDPGVYRVFNYGGALADNGMVLGTVPAAGFFLQTSVPNQVNLVNTEGLTFEFWDGANGPKNNGVIDGGNGTWQNHTGNDNWTQVAGHPNAPFTDRGFAVFMATPGTVSVDDSLGNVNVSGMQFASDGYLVQGDPITLAGSPAEPNATIVRVGDDAPDGANYTATIHAVLAGDSSLVKTDLGTLVLGGTNTYTGGTSIENGVLQIGADANLGAVGTPLGMDGGTLRTTATFASARGTTLNAAGGTFETAAGTQFTLSSPIGGSGALTKSGDGTLILTGAGSYTGGTTIGAGTLQLGDGGASGSVSGNITDNAALVFNRSDSSTMAGVISGSGTVEQAGSGTTILAGANTYAGGTLISAGTLQLGDGGASGSIVGDVVDNGTLAFNRADAVTFAGLVSGGGGIAQNGGGTTILTAGNSYAGSTSVNAGALYINGVQTGAGATTVASGATLGGRGTLGGDVTVNDGGTLSPGDVGAAPGTLAIQGSLSLGGGASLQYSFGQANVEGGAFNDLTRVQGDLTLGGTLNVVTSPGGSFDPGVYRIFAYGGSLVDNGLAIGSIPSSGFYVQTSVANQVNLVNTEGLTFNFWDGDNGPKNNGAVNGGNGIWQNTAGNDNWTQVAGHPNAPFADKSFAVFMATPGTVNVDDSLGSVNVSGMQFASDGYLVQGDPITLADPPPAPGTTIVRVGDGTIDGAGYTATIDAVLTGNSSLVKTDLGTLVLNAANSYAGGTQVQGGVLQISADDNLGAAGAPLGLDGGTLRTTATFASARDTTLGAAGGTFETAAGTQFTLSSPIGGSGALTKTGDGTLILTGDGSYGGGTTIAAGILQLGDGGASGSIAGDIVDNAALVFNRSDTSTLPGSIIGGGTVTQAGSGTTILTGDSTYTGGTAISAGTLQLGNGGVSGSIVGDVADNGTLAFDRSDVVTFDGLISGSGNVVQAGSGATILTIDDPYTGTTYVNAGTLAIGDASHRGATLSGGGAVQIAPGGTFGGYGSVAGSVYDSGTLAVADAVPAFAGSGGGIFTVNGTLYNAGLARVAGATVGNQLAAASYVGQGGNVALNAVLNGDGSPSDWLVIDGGTASGHSTLQVLNASGRGALTPGNGIMVVNAINGATTARGAFSLAGPVFAGPYEYVLYHGAFDGSDLDSWYLRSEEPSNGGLGGGKGDPDEPFEPIQPGEPEGPNEYIPGGREPEVPVYRPETSLYAALPAMALRYNQSLLDSLHERVGEENQLAGQPGMQQGGFLRGAWFRAIGGSGNVNGDANGIYGDGPKYDYDFYALQVGTDVYAKEHDDAQRDHAGVYLAQGRIFGDVANYSGETAGSDSITSTSLGLYWTHFWPQDAYVDLVWQGTWNKYKAQSVDALALQKHGFGWAASAEGGYPFHYGNQAIEPQAQVLYQKFDSIDTADPASQVTLRNISSLAARVGVRWADTLALEQAKNRDEQRQLTSWLRFNVWREFRGQPVAAFSSEDGDVPFHSDMKGNWWQFNGGVTLQLDRMLSFYTSAGYEHGFGPKATGFNGWDGQLGLRWNW
ncbi:autotransporter-associated beta strand repeat-containing protein [Dyella sedimenti]|uniref:autotransporter-associated beta strand repeat-containing protein n=1 Tax=Dyella sedimenti TaxID=2919947 RepID=UPI001FA9FA4E|nr:autotransporter-associated beta strand repeat-containing protein [Dyella sedimenti]